MGGRIYELESESMDMDNQDLEQSKSLQEKVSRGYLGLDRWENLSF
jgi:hypothetical protein